LTGYALRNLKYEMLEEAVGFARGAHEIQRAPLRMGAVGLIVDESGFRRNHQPGRELSRGVTPVVESAWQSHFFWSFF
jgi:hypothetical protein